MKWLAGIRHFIFGHFGGHYIGVGQGDVIDKKNLPENENGESVKHLGGFYVFFKCGYCDEVYTPQPLKQVPRPKFPVSQIKEESFK